MRLISIFFIFLNLAVGSICFGQVDNPIIKNVRLFDGDSVYQSVTIKTKNGTISSISKSSNIENDEGTVIDGTGYTLIPGMINAHFHTWAKKNLKEAVKSGVLGVLDMMLHPQMDFTKLKKLSQDSEYPYFYSANNPVTVPNGHGTFWKIETLKSDELTTGFIEDRISEGADFIKIILDHGYKNTLPTLTDNMLATTIQASKNYSKISVAHIGSYNDAIKVAKLGVSGLAHIWIYDSIQIPEEGLQVLKANDIFVIPTLYVYQKGVDLEGNPTNMNLLKSEVFRLYMANIPILAGTDAPNYKLNFGSDLFEEMKLLVEAGIPELEVLKTATSNVSKSFHLGQIGFIKVGYSADFVLIKGNPTENIEDLYNIEGIWKQGEFITPHNNTYE